MVFADKVSPIACVKAELIPFQRFARADKRAKLPRWINQYITEPHSNLSTDMAIHLSKLFIRSISQPFDHSQTGISLWTLEDIEERQKREKEKMDNELADAAEVGLIKKKDEGAASAQPMKDGGASGGFLAYDDDTDIMMEDEDEFASLGIDASELEGMELA